MYRSYGSVPRRTDAEGGPQPPSPAASASGDAAPRSVAVVDRRLMAAVSVLLILIIASFVALNGQVSEAVAQPQKQHLTWVQQVNAEDTRAVADAKTHIKSFIKHQEQANDARASAYAARWYQQTVTKAKERYEEDEERAAAAAAAAKLKGTKHLRLKQHPL